MSDLFDEEILDEYIKANHVDDDKIHQIKEIADRWHKTDLKSETAHKPNFFKEFFAKILCYKSETGDENNTLWWETGPKDKTRPDGILGFNLEDIINKDIRVVIEVKGDTVDLDKKPKDEKSPVGQAFDYAHKVGGKCEWVIVSNFRETRLYGQNDSSKYHKFLLADLATNEQKTKEFYLLLAKDKLFGGKIYKSDIHDLITKADSKKEEIQDEFYNQYKSNRTTFKEYLFRENQNKFSYRLCLNIADKILRRILFIVFCQERGLIDKKTLQDEVIDKKIGSKYQHLKDVFKAFDKGSKNIPAFNGGLFKEDKFIDELNISDDEVERLLFVLEYKFKSKLDVEILGYIFEKSISDMENEAEDDRINQINDSEKNDLQQRQKFGVYYTPKYITKFIVNEAISNWLNDRKIEIAKKYKEDSEKFIEEYKEKLSSIKIIDPACGSGAFLVEVLDFLIKEWKSLGENSKYKHILENNIYGVDINPKSVDITKLSLWLATSINREKLINLDKNILVGNSLIEDEKLAGFYNEVDGEVKYNIVTQKADELSFEDIEINFKEKTTQKSLAFNWDSKFNFQKFDVIVGNPPYIKEDKHKQIFEPLNPKNPIFKKQSKEKNTPPILSKYYQGKMDFWQFFTGLGIIILKQGGYLCYIAPNSWLTSFGASEMRSQILTNTKIEKYIDFKDNKIFKSADIQTMIMLLKKATTQTHKIKHTAIPNAEGKNFAEKSININKELQNATFNTIEIQSQTTMDNINDSIYFVSNTAKPLFDKIEKVGTYKLREIHVANGIVFPSDVVNAKSQKILGKDFKVGDGIFSITTAEKDALNLTKKELELIKPEYTTEQIDRYFANNKNTRWVIYTDSSFKKHDKIKEYPKIKKHLDKFIEVIISDNRPYGIHRARGEGFFTGEKIISLRKCTNRPRFSYVDFDSYVSAAFYVIKPTDINLKYLTGLLNSKLIAFYLKNKGKMQGSNYQIDKDPLCKIPIAIANANQQANIITKVELMLDTNNKINKINETMFKLLVGDFASININKKIEKWSGLSWGEFLSEITKQKFDINGKLKEDWLKRFEEKQTEIKTLQSTLTQTDTEIDKMVYALYNLTEEEIKVVEGLE